MNQSKHKSRKKAKFQDVIGSFNLVLLILAGLLALFCGFLFAYGYHLTLSVIDEVLFYDYLYIRNDNISFYPCTDMIPAVFTNNNTTAKQAIQTESRYVMKWLLIILIGYIVSSVLAQSLWTITLFRMMKRVRFGLFNQLLNKELSWYDVHPSTELAQLMTDCPIVAEEGLEKHLFICLEYFGIAISSIVISYTNSFIASLVSTLTMIATFFIISIVSKISSKRVQMSELYTSNAISIAEEALSSIRTVVAYGGKDFAVKRYFKNVERSNKSLRRVNLLFVFTYSFLMFISNVTYPMLFGLGYFLLKKCFISFEENVQVILFYGFTIGATFCGFSRLVLVVRSFTALKSIKEIFEKERSPEKLISHKVDRGVVEFCNVIFSYPSRPDVTVLHGVDFLVQSGKSVALIGPSGCGKTTIVKLLLGLYESYDGMITVDDVNLKEIDSLTFRKQIGLVSQEPTLFNVSIYNNISYGNPKAKRYMIEDAAKLANIHDFVMSLPDEYDTIVGEGGIKLSGGQKQRVAIARALVRNPKILVLDEATSALDKKNERIVQDALNNAMKGRTSIIIAHRLSTVRNADVIIGMENGYIVERGTHDELMDMRGLYYKLMMKQQGEKNGGSNFEDDVQDDRVIVVDSKPSMDSDQKKQSHGSSQQHSLKPLDCILLLIKRYKIALIVLLGCILFGVIGFILVFDSYLMILSLEKLISYQINGNTLMPIAWTAILVMFSAALAISVFASLNVVFTGGDKFVGSVRYDMLKAMIKQRMSWFDRPDNAVGILITNLTVNPSALHQILSSPLLGAFEFAFAFPTLTVLVILSSWKVALIIVPFISIMIISQLLYLTVTWTYIPKLRNIMKSYGKVAIESIKHVTTVKSLGISDSMESLYKEQVLKEDRLKLYLFAVRFVLQSLGFPILLSIYLLLTWMLFDELLTGSNVIKAPYLSRQYLKIVTVVSVFCGLYKSTLTGIPRFQDAISAVNDIARLMLQAQHHEENESTGQGLKPEQINTTISFHNVEFSYPSRPNIPVLTGVNISVKEGQTLAIVGASGSGKSTIVSLLERFYEPSSGVIQLGDYNINDLDIDWLHQQISIVSQEPVLFNMSIADNIRYGALHRIITDKEIIEAAKTAKIHEFIISLPQGYETVAGLDGHQLSGGQKQRVAIARAVIQDPKILLLDEATSSLDTENEKIVQEALKKARINRTTIMIAHRLSTIQDADKIVVLSKGKIVEEGNHSELMNKKGLYYEMTII